MGRGDEAQAGVPTVGEPPYVIRIRRTGGLAGLGREWEIEVTGPDDAERWRPLIEACPWDDAGGDVYPDAYVYDFHAAERAAVVPESRLQGPWRRLVDEVQRHAD